MKNDPEYARETGTMDIVPIENIAMILTPKIVVLFIVTC